MASTQHPRTYASALLCSVHQLVRLVARYAEFVAQRTHYVFLGKLARAQELGGALGGACCGVLCGRLLFGLRGRAYDER
ncbi:hypothetical protein, partial [Slackia equolifaciens]|uniref:hypothetical protein n=1 Tax=Slackia equolifaciens TaxID=498718 RepID=UPI0036313951